MVAELQHESEQTLERRRTDLAAKIAGFEMLALRGGSSTEVDGRLRKAREELARLNGELDAIRSSSGKEAPQAVAALTQGSPRKSKAKPATGEGKRVVVNKPDEQGGLRAVRVDGVLVGHAQKVPKEYRWTTPSPWAFKAVDSDLLYYFDSLSDIREMAKESMASQGE